MSYPYIRGYCPMGCGQTLFVGEGGYITCSWAKCPNPSAMSDIITAALVSHLVTLRSDTFAITHPLRERLDDLHECELERYLVSLDGPPRQPGRYLVDQSENGGWRFQPVHTSDEIAHRIGVYDE